MLARVVVLEVPAHSGTDAWDDVAAGLHVSLVVLVSTTKGMEVGPGLGIVESKLELSTIVPRRSRCEHKRRDRRQKVWVNAWRGWRQRRVGDPTRDVRTLIHGRRWASVVKHGHRGEGAAVAFWT